MYGRFLFVILIFVFVALSGCGSDEPVVIKEYPITADDEIKLVDLISFDSTVSYDGNGSFKIETKGPAVALLKTVSDIDIEKATLLFRAKIKTENFKGETFLEMWCVFNGMGRYFSRDLSSPVNSDVDWVTEETPFYLQEGQNPDSVKLGITINGQGTVWVDDIKLLKTSLP